MNPGRYCSNERRDARARKERTLDGNRQKYCTHLSSFSVYGILNGFDVDGVLIGQVVEHVMCLDRCRTRLLVSEYEIDPLVQMLSSQVIKGEGKGRI